MIKVMGDDTSNRIQEISLAKKKKIEKKGGFSEKRANFDDIYEGNSPYFRRNFRQIFN